MVNELLIIELLGFAGMILLLLTWYPSIREKDDLHNVIGFICTIFWLAQSLMLGLASNILTQIFLLVLIGITIKRTIPFRNL